MSEENKHWKSQSPKACLNCQSKLLKRHVPEDLPEQDSWAMLTFHIFDKLVLRMDLWECSTCGYVHFMNQQEVSA